jgi:hypothetical protein
MNGWILKTCMLILLKIIIKKYNFKSKQILGKKEITNLNEKPSAPGDELPC